MQTLANYRETPKIGLHCDINSNRTRTMEGEGEGGVCGGGGGQEGGEGVVKN